MHVSRVIALAGIVLAVPGLAAALQPDSMPDESRRAAPIVVEVDLQGSTQPLRTIQPEMPRDGALREIPLMGFPNRSGAEGSFDADPVVQAAPGAEAAPAAIVNFEGISNVNSVLPPDPNGDIGPGHYVQTVNLSFAIYSRTGDLLYGPAALNTLWSDFDGVCRTSNNGDPIVLYDALADRWMISQFALPNYPNGPFYQCIAVSQTPDPLDAWYLYQFMVSQAKMNDYAKFGVWPDGYYMTMNQYNEGALSWAGAGAAVFERDRMLQGEPARMVTFDLYASDPDFFSLLPADLDGPAPPDGAPHPFAAVRDDGWSYPQDQLEIWDMHADWVTPQNSTFNQVKTLSTAPFDSNMCGYSRNCVPQPGTNVGVDAISDRLMHRLQYRNFGSYQTLVVNHTVDANGANRAGVRWYELRNAGGDWSIYQQGTYSPDGANRWMAGIAMNGSGDIGLGYSVSSSTVYPSIRYTGRLEGDPLNQMTLGESTLIAGAGSQTSTRYRWGDYSMMAVDPVDDCTFWYTQEYYQTTSAAGWQTRIGAFRLSECTPDFGWRQYLPVVLRSF
jgi:hypothetical protein